MLIASTFRCVESMGLIGQIFGPLRAPKWVKIIIFGHFLKHFPLVSYQCWCTHHFELLLKMCWILASEAQFPGHLRPKNRSLSRSSVTVSNIFHWFHITLLFHAYWGYFMCIQWCAQNALFLGLEVAAEPVRPAGLLFLCVCHQQSEYVRLIGICLTTICDVESTIKIYIYIHIFPEPLEN